MKRIFLFTFFIFAAVYLNAQLVQRNMVVLEIATGTWCQYCPGAAVAAAQLLTTGANVAVIEYHNGDPYVNTASNARNTYYNVPGYPNDQWDGPNTTGVGGALCNNGSPYSNYQSMYNTRIAIQSPLVIDISGTNAGNTYNIVLSIKKTSTVSGLNLKAHLVLTESHITTSPAWPPNGQCMTEVEYVERLMVPDENGTDINFTSGDFQVVNLTFTKDPTWVNANCELVAFVQDYGTKEIYNGAKVALNSLPAPVSVSFTGVPTSGCTPFTVNYTSSGSGVNTYQWTLPGGTPNTSSNANPSVAYNTGGSYDVTLTAWNSSTNRGNKMSMLSYITATSTPGTPATPIGTTGLCVNPVDQTYSTTNVATATSYTWDLQPSSAGVLTPNGISCLVNWDNTFQGSATLKVKATNSCGDGPWSQSLTITVSPMPGTPGTPTGPSQLCQNPLGTTYTSSGTTPATAYTWELLPSTAGTLTQNWTTVTIDWNDVFVGTAQLHVMAVNNGCSGPWSDFLVINVSTGPSQYNVTGGGTYCAVGGTGLPVGLAGSQLNTNYTLYKDGTATSTVVPGTGGTITFGNQTAAGTYTVNATSTTTTCSSTMNGSAVIAVDPQAPNTPATPQGPGEPTAGTASNYTTAGGTYATSYSWAVTPSNAGVFTGTTTTGTINWNTSYSGQASVKVQGVNSCGGSTYSTELSVTVLPFTGINETGSRKIAVFSPNPARGQINLVTSSKTRADLTVYNSIGITVLEKKDLFIDGSLAVDVSSLATGIYFFGLTNQDSRQIEKIIIEK